ncbi:uncharacterized protein DNG_07359 [Cephalotrichum gorgonifer]|uniref:Heterokaryon incompatibility domain-containing protein n=1 Tax=Cephalotrichum gorgonifer TaxID=2041049 RepID=A0AAE8N397_9PEZI|nr:uncharacterized protein DNG_07359 [Cephalotrichum gorgonifer]
MPRFFGPSLEESADKDGHKPGSSMHPRIIPRASAPGTHVCTSVCKGIASLPPEYHESVIAQLTEGEGVTPDSLEIQSLSMSNLSYLPEQTRPMMSELEERRAIEGNTDMAHLPLALPTTYKYPPLPMGHVRFLRFGGLGPHPLAELESHSLENPPPYVAVSYFWDSSSPRRGMFVDYQSFGISETVLEVLNQVQSLQHVGRRPLLWIDQICINQDDQEEKLDQIYRMGQIYSKAQKVFIWLGTTAHRSDFALESMERMEALLARKLVVMCGYREVSFDSLIKLASELRKYGSLDLIRYPDSSDQNMNNALSGIVSLRTLQLQGDSTKEVPKGLDIARFRDLVALSRTRQVTFPADRVHALMGVAPRRVREYMADIQRRHPNQSMWQLYTEFAKCILVNDPGWHFLSSAPSEFRPGELPSWVPNLNSRKPFASDLTRESHRFSAGISPGTQHLISRAITAKELVARGIRIDTVTEIIPQTAFGENMKRGDAYGASVREWEQACAQLSRKVYNLGPGQVVSAHIGTLMGQSLVEPAMDGRAVDAYRVFLEICRVGNEALRLINEGGISIPEPFRHLPDPVNASADYAVKRWLNDQPAEKYRLLLEFTDRMKNMSCSESKSTVLTSFTVPSGVSASSSFRPQRWEPQGTTISAPATLDTPVTVGASGHHHLGSGHFRHPRNGGSLRAPPSRLRPLSTTP